MLCASRRPRASWAVQRLALLPRRKGAATVTTRYLCDLTDAHLHNGCGNKAAQLARLMQEGLPVPPGFVVTAAALDLFLEHNRLTEAARELAESLEHDRDVVLSAEHFRRRVLSGTIPPTLSDVLSHHRRDMPDDAIVIVRSSALGEDGAAASFAGQLDSILDVAPAALGPALLACWASYWSDRAIAYQRAR